MDLREGYVSSPRTVSSELQSSSIYVPNTLAYMGETLTSVTFPLLLSALSIYMTSRKIIHHYHNPHSKK